MFTHVLNIKVPFIEIAVIFLLSALHDQKVSMALHIFCFLLYMFQTLYKSCMLSFSIMTKLLYRIQIYIF